MARKKNPEPTEVKSIRLPSDLISVIREIAALETLTTGRQVYADELIRGALRYVFSDNERLRESFRRSRVSSARKYQDRS